MPKSDQFKNNKHKSLYINSKLKVKKTTKMKNTFSFW